MPIIDRKASRHEAEGKDRMPKAHVVQNRASGPLHLGVCFGCWVLFWLLGTLLAIQKETTHFFRRTSHLSIFG